MKPLIFVMALFISTAAWAQNSSNPKLRCPKVSSTGLEQLTIYKQFKLNRQETLLICVPEDSLSSSKLKNPVITRYEGFLHTAGRRVGKRVLSGSSRTPVQFEQRKGVVYEIAQLEVRGLHMPLFQEKIVCSKGTCRRKEKVCVFNQLQLSPPSPKELEREKIIFAKGKAKVQPMSEKDLNQMATLALAGRKTAYEFFAMKEEPLLSGSVRDSYRQLKTLLQQIRTEGRLKVVASK